MVGDVLNWSLSTACCFASGLSVFPGTRGGVFSTVESPKRSREAKAGERFGVEAVTEAKLHFGEEWSAEF